MNQFSNNVVYGLSFLAIFIYMLIDFDLNGHKEFPQLDFDWKREKVIKDYGKSHVLSMTHNTLNLSFKEDLISLNNNNTLRIITSKGKFYYFRYEYKVIKGRNVQLRGGIWLTKQPKYLGKTTVSVIEIYLPMVKNGNIDVCFIGFSDNKWGGFRSIRKYLKHENQNINFVGSRQDIYGFPYIPIQIKNRLDSWDRKLNPVPNADFYIVFVESLDKYKNKESWKLFFDKLSKAGKTIFINTWPELKENNKNKEIKKINSFLYGVSESIENVKILDLNIKNEAEGTISDNGLYFMKKSGYQLYKKKILEEITNKKE